MALFGRILGTYSPKYGPILPKFSPEVVQTTLFEKNLKDSSFHKKEKDPKFALLVQL